jgi:methylmalonyl-CoA mutase C-terminal domain/subunit
MPKRTPYRILIAKGGLDGHDRGAKVVIRALTEAGFEVIYTGLHQTAAAIANAAVQEDVHAVGLSVLSGAHMTLFPKLKEKLDEADRGEILLFGGGIIPDEDKEKLEAMGIGRLFQPGTPTAQIVTYLQETLRGNQG